jgi:hypothetical protein
MGDAWDNVQYKIEMDFGFVGRPSFTDVWLNVSELPYLGNFKVGQWKQPFFMDAMTSIRELTFLERGLPFAFVPFRQDRFRYLGALGAASLNVKFYGFDPEGPLADDPVDYTLEPLFLFQRLQARINRSDLFVGAHYLYLNATSTFDVERPDEIPPRDLEVNVGGFGTSI